MNYNNSHWSTYIITNSSYIIPCNSTFLTMIKSYSTSYSAFRKYLEQFLLFWLCTPAILGDSCRNYILFIQYIVPQF